MKLLLDQNISYRLVKSLRSKYPDTTQVALLHMGESTDLEIWEYAKAEEYIVVTQDADFHEYSVLYGGPPLVLWLKCGNQPRSTILSKILDNHEIIMQAAQDNDVWCLEIY